MDDFLTKPVDAGRLADDPASGGWRPVRGTPTGWTWTGSRSCGSSTTPDDGSSYVDRALGNFLGGTEALDGLDGDRGGRRGRRPAAGRWRTGWPAAALNLGAARAGRGRPGARGAHHERLAGRRRCGAAASSPSRWRPTWWRCAPTSTSSLPGSALVLVALVPLVEQPLAAGRCHEAADLPEGTAAVVDLVGCARSRTSRRARRAVGSPTSSLAGLRIVAGLPPRSSGGGLGLGELLDGVVEGVGVGALELEHLQQRLVPLGVLLLAVLGLVLAHRAAMGRSFG